MFTTTQSTARVVQVENCSKSYGSGAGEVHALEDVSLEIARGEFVALVGPSGSGKSTLLSLVGALDIPTRGRVLLRGVDLAMLSDRGLARIRRSEVATIFQSFYLLPTLNVSENVALPAHLLGQPPREIDRSVVELLDAVGLRDRALAWPDTLSGGEMQRVAIARAMINRPQILLADEPTGNLDSQNAARVLDLLSEVSAERQMALLLATHSPESVRRADRVVEMRDGRIVRP